jgi:rRNA maturation endonuclease Nob1
MKIHGGGLLDPSKPKISREAIDAINSEAASSNANDTISSSTTTNEIKTTTTSAAGPSAAGPPLSQRAACATTDFAMQNVLLQMNLVLLSVDGMRIRRLKSWVIRCGACFKIHSNDDDFMGGRMKRLFCSHCGSGDMMQRISCSVDSKTGRLKLHFSKRRQGKHLSTRGTKFSLPKPGSGNRFQGDLLLREDQLLMGAWNQKVKIRSGNAFHKAKGESMFGKDLAATVGCNVKPGNDGGGSGSSFGSSKWATGTSGTFVGATDIRVGFGARKNPNSVKGRERRGKKKKSTDRACGLRRY